MIGNKKIKKNIFYYFFIEDIRWNVGIRNSFWEINICRYIKLILKILIKYMENLGKICCFYIGREIMF